jgi:pimeloyl-ACP methyl ester carboxylesterase
VILKRPNIARRLFSGALLALLATSTFVFWTYQHDLRRARDRTRRGSAIVRTSAGPIEYAEFGTGYPILFVHGAGGGFDQGLAVASEFIGKNGRVIAPSRFGYLGTPVSRDTSVSAQADAHAALLDQLSITKSIVVGISAGARSAVELALRHAEKVKALILIVPGTYSPTSPVSITAGRGNEFAFWAVNNGGDLAWWAAEKLAPSVLIRFIGVRPELVSTATVATRRRVMNMVETIEPLSSRFTGIVVDSHAALHELPLSKIKVPTLIVSARDDLFNTLPAAQHLANRIPGAQLVVYDNGGHLLIGHEQDVQMRIRRFISAEIASGRE